jgi:hypothetical protein
MELNSPKAGQGMNVGMQDGKTRNPSITGHGIDIFHDL